MLGLFQQSSKFAEGSRYQSAWPLPLEIIINGVKESASTLYQRVSKNLRSESELSFFEKAQRNSESFQRYRSFCDKFAEEKTGISNVLKTNSPSPQLLQYELLLKYGLLLGQQEYQKNIISPVEYHRRLMQLERRITKVLSKVACREACARLRDKLKIDTKATKKYFYDDIMNHLIQLAGHQISFKVFQQVLFYYRGLIEESLYSKVMTLMQPLIMRFEEKEKSLYDVNISDQTYANLAQQLDAIFAPHFLEKNSLQETISTASDQSLWQQIKQTGSQLVQTAQEHPQAVFWGMVGGAALGFGVGYAANVKWEINFGMPASWSTQFAELNGFMASTALNLGLSYLRTNTLDFGLPSALPLMVSMVPWIGSTMAQSSTPVFFQSLEGVGVNSGQSVAQTVDGGYIVTGITSVGAGALDVFLAKLNVSGHVTWAASVGGPNDDVAGSVMIATDGRYLVTGYTASGANGPYDLFLFKCDENGNLLWAKKLGGSGNDQALAGQATADGGCIVSGLIDSPGAAGSFDAWLVKWDASGNLIWQKTIGGSAEDRGYDVKVTPEGSYLVGGRTSSYGSGGFDKFLLKVDSAGNLIWAKVLGGSGNDYASGVQVSADGNYYVAVGLTASFGVGRFDQFLSSWHANGTLRWVRTLGGLGDEQGFSAEITSAGEIRVVGHTTSFGTGNDDMLLSRWLASGGFIEAKTFGSTGDDGGNDLQITSDGGLFAIGVTNFGASTGGASVLLVKSDSQGNIDNCPSVQSVSPLVNPVVPNVNTITPIVGTPTVNVNTWAVSAQFINFNQSFVCFGMRESTTGLITTSVPSTSGRAPTTGSPIVTTSTRTPTSSTTDFSPSTGWVGSSGFASFFFTTSPITSTTNPFTSSTSTDNKPSFSSQFSSSQDNSIIYVGVGAAVGTLAIVVYVGGVTYFFIYKHRQTQELHVATIELGELKSMRNASGYYSAHRQDKKHTTIGDQNSNFTYELMNKLTHGEAKDLQEQTDIKVKLVTPNKYRSKYILADGQVEGHYGKLKVARIQSTGQSQQSDMIGQYVGVKKIDAADRSKFLACKDEADVQLAVQGYPHIMELLDAFESTDSNKNRAFYLFMPLYGHGDGRDLKDLFKYFSKSKSPEDKILKEKLLRYIAKCLLTALEIHEAEPPVYHLDIKLSNFVLNKYDELAVIDFGCGKKSKNVNLEGGNGDVLNMPPERINHIRGRQATRDSTKEIADSYRADKADIWSVGCTLWELAEGNYLFEGMNGEKLIAHWDSIDFKKALEEKPQLRDAVPDSFFGLVKQLLQVDPLKRPAPKEALSHSIFKDENYLLSKAERIEAFKKLRQLSKTEREQIRHQEEPPKEENKNYASNFYMSHKEKTEEKEFYNTKVMRPAEVKPFSALPTQTHFRPASSRSQTSKQEVNETSELTNKFG